MVEQFKFNISEKEYVVVAEYNETDNRIVVRSNDVKVVDKEVSFKVGGFFTAVVFDENNVAFICVERKYKSFKDKLLKKNPEYVIDAFIDGKSVKDGSLMTRLKDFSVQTLEAGFGRYVLKKLKLTLPPAVVLVAVGQILLISTNNFQYKYGIVDALLNLAEVLVIVVFLTCLGWYKHADTVEKWDELFD